MPYKKYLYILFIFMGANYLWLISDVVYSMLSKRKSVEL